MKTIFCTNRKSRTLDMFAGIASAIVHALKLSLLGFIPSQTWESVFRVFMVIFLQKQAILDLARKCCLQFLMLMVLSNSVFAKIKNGYEKDIAGIRESFKSLQWILTEYNNEMSADQRRKIESKMEILTDQIAYFELTENLLSQFKQISPRLFAEIDTITDRLGRAVDVYVKFVPMGTTKEKAYGSTYLSQIENDSDGYQSEYGKFTVSVKVWIVHRALLVLAHEFGHVKYQVPNLARYMEFHKQNYREIDSMNLVGHHTDDLSGKSADQFGKIFWKEQMSFLKATDKKTQNPVGLFAKIRKGMNRAQVMM